MIAVVLAAGNGRRLGGVNKARIRYGSELALERIARIGREAGVVRFVVVVGGDFAAQTAQDAQALQMDVVINPQQDSDMAQSIACGFRELQRSSDTGNDSCNGTALPETPGALLWPVDHARIHQATLTAIRQAGGQEHWVIPTFHGESGHPVFVGAALFAQLATCDTLPNGARAVRDMFARTIRVPVPDEYVIRDVDTRASLESLS